MKMKKTESKPRRLTLRGWAVLEDLRMSIQEEAERGNYSAIPGKIIAYIQLTVDKFDANSFWLDAAVMYSLASQANLPSKDFPLLSSKEKPKKMPWEYQGRSWYFWLNLFASNYGWSAEEIGEMDIDDAIGLYQEILVDKQFEDEFQYGLSEIAYPYNSSTKKSSFKPLPRPDWMRMYPASDRPVVVKKVKILKTMMPQGNVISLDGTND